MNSIKFILIAFILLGILVSSFFIVSRDKYSHYNVLSLEGKCKWEVAKGICESNGYEFKNVGIWMNSIIAKCSFKNSMGGYSTKKTKLTKKELVNCVVNLNKEINVSRWK